MDLTWFDSIGHSAQCLSAFFSLLEETADTYILLWNLREDTFYISPAAHEKYDIPSSDPEGAAVFLQRIVYPPDLAKTQELFFELKRGVRDRFVYDYRLVDKNGERRWVSADVRRLPGVDGAPDMLVGNVTEVSRDNRADEVTGLLGQGQLQADYAAGLSYEETAYLLIMGIDDFKAVNDRHGRKFGNQVLKLFAAVLERQLGGGRVYRLDGDRFAVVLVGKNRVAVGRFYAVVRQAFRKAVQGMRANVFCGLSGGAAAYPADSDDFQQLMQFADSALGTAKRSGKNNLIFFSRESYEDYLQDLSLKADLQHCVNDGFAGFEVYYQPLVSVASGQVEGAEALLRWTSADHGKVPPSVFIPLLEESGLICEVGRWVIEQAVEQCRIWRQALPAFLMSINVSNVQLEKDDVAGFLLGILRRARLPGNAVMLEMTESERMNDYKRYNETLSYLRRIGVAVAIDDFGTGYSSLGYFKELDISFVKVDRSFVTRILESEYDYRLVQFIIELAHSIGVKVCVEGVESRDEATTLLPLLPDVLQGYHFGHPVPAGVFEAKFIRDWGETGDFLRAATEEMGADAGESTLFDFVSAKEWMLMADEMDELVVISELDSCRILHMNRAARQFYVADEPPGQRTCYQVMMGRDAMCENCNKSFLRADRFSSIEYQGRATGEPLLVRAKVVPWKGRMARMSIALPKREGYEIARKADHQLKVERTIVASALALAEGRDLKTAVEAVLMEIGDFYKADRAYVFEMDENGEVARNTYEWCVANVAPQMDIYQNVNFSENSPGWLATMNRHQAVVSLGPEDLKRQYPQEYKMLNREGLKKFILAPFFIDGRLGGFAGVDNPRYAQADPGLLTSLSYFLANEISQRQLSRRLHRLSYEDALTGVNNRNRYVMDIGAVVPTELVSLGVVFADLNGLKEVNDREGHHRGDGMIRLVAQDLQRVFSGCGVYRIGGDEFVVLCRNVTEERLAENVAEMELLRTERDYSISLGSAWAGGNIDIGELTHLADQRMYESKSEYYNGQFYRQARSNKA